MAFIDTYHFHAFAGNGGDGVVRWHREKFRPKGGPCGGNAGRGADFTVRAVRDITRLGKLVHVHLYKAENGENGGDNSRTGKSRDAYVLELPIGSIITRKSDGSVVELLHEGEVVRLLEGGEGGKGNEYFKSSTNQQPTQCTKGKKGENDLFTVELRIMADVGLVGLPNAGKTSLLNALTSAGAKVGDYPFTTLDPNLGVYHGFVLADIPGLVEGASEGKGLGHKFLRHVARTRIILHCISLERDTNVEEYEMVRKELKSFDNIQDKKEFIIFTKTDTCSEDEVVKRVAMFEEKTGLSVFSTLSILDDLSVKKFADALIKKLVQMDVTQ